MNRITPKIRSAISSSLFVFAMSIVSKSYCDKIIWRKIVVNTAKIQAMLRVDENGMLRIGCDWMPSYASILSVILEGDFSTSEIPSSFDVLSRDQNSSLLRELSPELAFHPSDVWFTGPWFWTSAEAHNVERGRVHTRKTWPRLSKLSKVVMMVRSRR
jgi:hypothetical protein